MSAESRHLVNSEVTRNWSACRTFGMTAMHYSPFAWNSQLIPWGWYVDCCWTGGAAGASGAAGAEWELPKSMFDRP